MANGNAKRVITRAGRSVFSNGELVGTFDDPIQAEREAQKFAAGPGNMRGSTSGSTLRRERSRTTRTPEETARIVQQNEEGASAAGERRLRRQGFETPKETMARLRGTNFATDQARQDALEGSLAESSLAPGTDVPQLLEDQPSTRQLLEESIGIQTGQAPSATMGGGAAGDSVPEDETGITTSGQAERDMQDMQDRLTDAERANIAEQRGILDSITGGGDTDGTGGGGGTGAAGGTGDGTDISMAGVDLGFEQPDTVAEERLIEQQRRQIEEDLDMELSNIRERFQGRRASQKRTTRGRVGGTRGLVARAGAGTFASGQSAIEEEIQRGEQAMQELDALESQAIRAAKAAAAGQDIEMLEKSINLAEEARAERNNIRQQQFDNFVAMRAEQRAEQEFEREGATAQMELISGLGSTAIDSLPQEELQQIAEEAGLPAGYFDTLQTSLEQAEVAETEEAKFERQKEVFDMAIDMPAGMEFQLGEHTIKGMDVGDRKMFKSTDNAGNVTFTTVDPSTGEVVNTSRIAGIDKARISSGGPAGEKIPSEVAAAIATATGLIGQTDPDTGEVFTASQALQAVTMDPTISQNPNYMEYAQSSIMNVAQSGTNFKYITESVEVDGEDTPVLITFNPDTGQQVGEPQPIQTPGAGEGDEGEGIFSSILQAGGQKIIEGIEGL